MDDLESSVHSLSDLLVLKDGVGMVLRGHNEELVVKTDSPVLNLPCTTVPVSPDLEVMPKNRVPLVYVIHDDDRLLLVAIEPLIAPLREERAVWCCELTSIPRLADA